MMLMSRTEAWSRAKLFVGFVAQTQIVMEWQREPKRQRDRETEQTAGGSLKTCHNSQAKTIHV